jgi:glycosyltransferase involved in cell wall biosynthesis
MHLCLISNQIAAWGKIGGFGTATRAIGGGLARRGIQVSAVVPRRAGHGQAEIESLDGMTVHGVSHWDTMTGGAIFREIGANIYHSQEPTIASYFAQRAAPNAIHIVTCRDPRGLADHMVELRHTNFRRRLIFPLTWYYEASPLVKRSVERADVVFCPAPCLVPRIKRLYGDSIEPHFVPSPVDLPGRAARKSPTPLALFVGRFDRRKRIERFFELAAQFPDVRFVAVGRAHDARYDRRLREKYGGLPNVELPGFLSRFGDGGLYQLYERAWILVNTSAREGLPYTFVEGAGWGCAILSCLNPDGFAERFGRHVEGDDFASGLSWLLAEDRWRVLGLAGARHVHATFSEENSIQQHLRWYQALLARKAAA